MSELLYIMNPNCGWCKKSDPVVQELVSMGHVITTLDVSSADDNKRANEVKAKYNAQCGTPLFIDADTGNMACGYREKDILEKWAKGEKIPQPPPRQPQQKPQQQQQVNAHAKSELLFNVWQEARQFFTDKFYEEGKLRKKQLEFPTEKEITSMAEKISQFIQKNS
jgi:thiol-disulfide isomerase/thioredoxin